MDWLALRMEDLVGQSFAALERARAVRDSRYKSYLPESYTPLSEYAKVVLEATATYLQQCIDSRVRFMLEDRHACEAGCARFQLGDAYICRRRGNLHYCDATRCDERREYVMDASGFSATMFSEDTCVFTGKRYGTIFEEQMDDRQGSMSQFITEKVKIKTPKPPKPVTRPPRVRSKTGVKGRKLAKETIAKQQNQSMLLSQARNHLLSMLPGRKAPDNLADKFAATAVRLWVKVHEPAEKMYRALKYHFNYHCYVLMYYMQEGFGVNGLFLLPQSDFLAQHLPSMKDLGRFKIKTKWHTKSTRQFLVAVSSLPAKELDELSRHLRSIWT